MMSPLRKESSVCLRALNLNLACTSTAQARQITTKPRLHVTAPLRKGARQSGRVRTACGRQIEGAVRMDGRCRKTVQRQPQPRAKTCSHFGRGIDSNHAHHKKISHQLATLQNFDGSGECVSLSPRLL